MRPLFACLIAALLGGLLLSADAPPPAKDKKAPPDGKQAPPARKGPALQVGADLPGPFHPYNINGPEKGRFHCLISAHGLDPMVMILHKGTDISPDLETLLQKLDAAIAKNPTVRLAAFAVFIPEELTDIVGASDKSDDTREKLVKELEPKAANLKHVVLCLDSKTDLEKYDIEDAGPDTVVVYRDYKVLDLAPAGKEKLNAAAVTKILAAVSKLGASRQ